MVYVCVCGGQALVYKNKSRRFDRKIKESIRSVINQKHGGTNKRRQETEPAHRRSALTSVLVRQSIKHLHRLTQR